MSEDQLFVVALIIVALLAEIYWVHSRIRQLERLVVELAMSCVQLQDQERIKNKERPAGDDTTAGL